MKPLVSVSIALTLAGVPCAAFAQVTQAYSYDANGRLVGVTTTGSGGTNTATYVYDDADNRTSRSQAGTTAYASLESLGPGVILRPDQSLLSPDGRFSFALRSSGELEIWAGQAPVWSTAMSPSGHSPFRLGPDGVAEVQPANLAADELARLELGDDGVLVLRKEPEGEILWTSGQLAGGL